MVKLLKNYLKKPISPLVLDPKALRRTGHTTGSSYSTLIKASWLLIIVMSAEVGEAVPSASSDAAV